tara:strand:- start:168 stop:572 length:405 start_codon:yes stop_codon:yes gene_type:complete
MILLTIDNAKSLLKKGEIYRIGTNALNILEFTYEHKGFKNKNPMFKKTPPFLENKMYKELYLHGLINWLNINFDMEEQKTDFRFHALKMADEDMRFQTGAFCAWNGEPLWLLEDYEGTHLIAHERQNEMMLPSL